MLRGAKERVIGQKDESAVVLIVEPICRGDEHVQFNSALIATALLAFPQDSVEFWGSDDHVSEVRNLLALRLGSGNALARTTWKVISPLERSSSVLRTLPSQLRLYRKAVEHAVSAKARCCVFTATTATSLLAMRLNEFIAGDHPPVLSIFHSALSELALPTPRSPFRRVLSIKGLLAGWKPLNIRNVVLGPSILKEAKGLIPASESIYCMEHPYLWATEHVPSPASRAVHFGSLGGTWKGGVDAVIYLQQQVRMVTPTASFSIIGAVEDEAAMRLRDANCDTPPARLSVDDYSARVLSIDYALWIADPEPYRLSASGSFLDTLSYIRPGLFLRNAFVESYFERLGDIGYLCNSVEEMARVARELAVNPPIERYRAQCQNILLGRRMFEPAAVAEQLRELVKSQNPNRFPLRNNP